MGRLQIAGLGVPTRTSKAEDVEARARALAEESAEANWRLLSRLREDEHAQVLMEACDNDARLGRMTPPKELSLDELGEHHLSPRFGVEQGLHVCLFQLVGAVIL